MVTENKQAPLTKSPGLRDANTGHNEESLDEIKAVLDRQNRYLIIIGKLEQLCIEFAERKTLEDLEKSHIFAKCVFKMEAELKLLNSGYYNNLTDKYLDSYESEINALEATEATIQVNKLLAKKVIQTKATNRKKGKSTYTFEKAKEVCEAFSKQNPKWLNIDKCAHGVKVKLGNILADEMGKKENFERLTRKTPPHHDTIDINVNQALKALGFTK